MNEKPVHIKTQEFRPVREAGYAQEEVDLYLEELVASYNRLMDSRYEALTESERLREVNSDLATENESLNNRVAELDARVAAFDEEVATINTQLENFRALNGELENTVNGLNEELQNRSTEFSEVSARNSELENEIVAARDEAERARNLLAEREEIANESMRYAEERIAAAERRALDAEETARQATERSNTQEVAAISENVNPEAEYHLGAPLADEHTDADIHLGETDDVNAETNEVGENVADTADSVINHDNTDIITEDHTVTPQAVFSKYEAVIYNPEASASDRANALVQRAYELGEEYIVTSTVEGDRIIAEANENADAERKEADEYSVQVRDEANQYSEVTRTEADQYSTNVKADADVEAEEIVAKANHEAEFVANSVSELREERDDVLGKLRDFYHMGINRIEEIAELPEYDPASFEERETIAPVVVEVVEIPEVTVTPEDDVNSYENTNVDEGSVDENGYPTDLGYGENNDIVNVAPYAEETTLDDEDYTVEEIQTVNVNEYDNTDVNVEETHSFEDTIQAEDSVLETTEGTHVESPLFNTDNTEINGGGDSSEFSEAYAEEHAQPATSTLRSFSSIINPEQAHYGDPSTHTGDENGSEADTAAPESEPEATPKKKRSFKDLLTGK